MKQVSTARTGTIARRRRGLKVAAVAALVGVIAVGTASPSAARHPQSGEPVTITLVALSSARPGMDPVIAEFESAQDEVRVEATYYEPGDAYNAAVPTQFAGGNGSDIVMVLGGHASPYSTTAFAQAGYLTDLSAEPWVDTMYEATKPLYEFEGGLYARDLGVAPLALLSYDKAFFTENDLAVPTTFDELIALCGAINEAGRVPIAWGGGNPAVNANNLATLAGRTVFAEDPDWLDARLNDETTFVDTPGWHQAVDDLQAMIDNECFSPGVGGAALTDMINQFATGQTAMMYTYGGLNGQVLEQTPDLDIGMFPPPGHTPDTTRVTVQASGGLGIWSESENPDAARAFLEFLSDPEVSASFTSANQLLSPAEATEGTLPGIYAELEPWFTAGDVVADITARWPNTQMNTLTGQSVQGMFTGQKTVDDVLADMDTYFEQT
jgi:raffinose/stachyose/melibiose transport system substrate-binding protein